jgi:uncharacterized lipoprotein YmbA
MKPLWWAIPCVVLVTGCGGAAGLESSLQSQHGPLAYLHDGEKISEKQAETLRIGSVTVEDVLPETTTVKEESGFFLPLLVVNIWKYDYESRLGRAQLSNDYKAFIKDSVIEELRRSGKYNYVDDHGDMEIDLRIKEITMTAPMRKTGNVIFVLYAVSYHQTIWAGPAEVFVTADAVLKQDGKEIFNQEFRGRGKTGMLQAKKPNLQDLTTAMIEALSSALKNLNESIVREINKT